jgi:hypothetical protein
MPQLSNRLPSAAGHYPRVLIVGGPYGTQPATITTLRNLFHGWPEGHLAQVSFDFPGLSERDELTPRLCRVPLSCQPIDYHVRRLVRSTATGVLSGAPENPSAGFARGARPSLKARLHANARAFADTSPVLVPAAAQSFAHDFSPDLIYSTLHSVRTMALVGCLARTCDCPVVPHFMDDWPTTLYSSGELGGLAHWHVARLLRKLLRQSSVMLCISPAMANEYQWRFGMPCRHFMNCADADRVNLSLTRSPDHSFVICYVGNIQNGRIELINLLARASARLPRGARPLEIVLYPGRTSHQERQRLAESGRVIVHEFFEDAMLRDIRANVDAFLHLDSFDQNQREYFRLSLSTKLPLYMSCGLPIFAIGPSEVNSMRYLSDVDAGMAVTEPSLSAITAGLTAFIKDAERRRLWGEHGLETAARHHDSCTQRRAFQEALADACHLARH